MRKHVALDKLVVAIMCLMASISIVYFPITKYDIYDGATGGKNGDVAQYVKIYQGASLDDIPKPYRYRILTPYLARLVPFLPESITKFYEITPEKIIAFRFGIVNLLGLTTTSFLLFWLCQSLSFSFYESLTASFLFLTNFVVVNTGGVPLVDALAWFFLTFGILAVLKNWHFALFASFSLGMFAKETTILVLPCIFLLADSIKSKITKTLLCLPAVVAYFVFRLIILPTNDGYNYAVGSAIQGVISLLTPNKSWIWIAIDGGLAFGALWLLALHGWLLVKKERRSPLYQLSFVLPIIILMPFLIGSNIGRIWFLAFPIVIPLSLLSLRHILINAQSKI